MGSLLAEFELLQNASVPTDSQGTVSSELLITLFSQVEFDTTNAKGLLCISRNIYRLLERDPGLAKDIYPFMASQEFGRRYYFEQFVNIDALNHHYGDGLNYYPMHTDDREQLFFVYSVLCLRAFLNCQRTHFDFYYDKISDYTHTEIRAFPPALLGRYYAVEVLNCAVNHCDINFVCEALALFQHQRQSGKDSGAVTFAHYILGTALVLAGDFEQAWTLLHEEFEHVKNAQDNKREQYVRQYKLLHLYAGYSPQSRRRPPHPLPQKHPKPKRRCAPGGKGNAARLLKRRIHAAQPLNVA